MTRRLVVLVAAAFVLGVLVDRVALATSRPAPAIPAAGPLGAQSGPDRAQTEAPRELGAPPAQATASPHSPSPAAAATPRPKALTGATSVSGIASWYAWHPAEAAAGPALRAYLGPHWRGRVVRVCVDARCAAVRLTDWCQCYRGTDRERLIDLDRRTFAMFAWPSRGLIEVEIHA